MAQPSQPQYEFHYQKVELFKTEELGVGSYGAVCKARCDDLPCAAKILHRTLFQFSATGVTSVLQKFEQECRLLSAIKHPHIVQYLGTYHDPESKLPVLLMELMDESLTRFLEHSHEPLPYHTEVNFYHDIGLALSYLHSNGIVHRDLSSNNVLLIAGSRAKVTDFGMVKLYSVNHTTAHLTPFTLCPGTVAYMSPEALGEPPIYTDKLDSFSLGVLGVQIMTRQFPDPGDRFNVIEINDPRVPFGKVKVDIPEIKRRQSHIDLIDPAHPLLPLALDCLKDRDRERPSCHELCGCMSTLKASPKYTESVQVNTKPTQSANRESREREMQLSQQIQDLQQQLHTKDDQLCALRDQLQEKEQENRQQQQQILGQWSLLTETNDQLQTFRQRLTTKDEQLAGKDHQLQQKEAAIAAHQQEIQQLRQQLHTRSDQLQEKEQEQQQQILGLQNLLTETNDQLQMLQQQLTTKDEQVAGKEKELTDKYEQLKQKEAAIATLQQEIQHLGQQLQFSEQVVAEFQQILLDREMIQDQQRLFQELQPQPRQRESQRQHQERQLAGKEEELGGKEEELGGKEEELAGKEEELAGKEEELGGKEEELAGKDEQLAGQRQEEEEASGAAASGGSIKLRWRDGGRAPRDMWGEVTAVDGSVAYFQPRGFIEPSVIAYNSEDNKWSELPKCHNHGFSLAMVKSLLTAIGGEMPTNEATNSLLSLIDNKWTEVFPPMPTKRWVTAAVCSGRSLVVAGGSTGYKCLSTVEVMDTKTLQWSTASSLPHPLRGPTATLCGDQVYMLGGWNRSLPSNAVFTCSLNALLQSCQSQSPRSPEERKASLFTHLGAQLKTLSLTSRPKVWHQLADTPVTYSTCASLHGKLLAVGGCDSAYKETTTAINMYNTTTDSWEVISHMATARHQCLVAVLPHNELMVVGGFGSGISHSMKAANSVEIAAIL